VQIGGGCDAAEDARIDRDVEALGVAEKVWTAWDGACQRRVRTS
jgi:hypothetical protein